MCLGIPGKIIDVTVPEGRPDLRMGTVDFDGVRREVCLAYAPEARVGDYVIVHVGFAISVVDPEEAERTLEVLRAIPDALDAELGPPQAEPAASAAAGAPAAPGSPAP